MSGDAAAAAPEGGGAAAESPRAAARRAARERRQLRMLVPMLLAAVLQASPRARESAADVLEAALVAARLKAPEVLPWPPANELAGAPDCDVCAAGAAELQACAAGAAREPLFAPRVALLTHAPGGDDAEAHAAWAAAVAATTARYAARHGYAFRLVSPPPPGERHPSWAKVALLRQYTQHGSPFAAVLWLDPGVLIAQHARSLDFMLSARLGDAPKDLVAFEASGQGAGALADTSALLVRATPWSRAFLARWWRAAARLRSVEAALAGEGGFAVTDALALDALWRADAAGVTARGVLLPRRALSAGGPLWAKPPGWALLLGERSGDDEGPEGAPPALRLRLARAALRAACGDTPPLDAAALARATERAHAATIARNAHDDDVAAAQHALGRMAAARGDWEAAIAALRAAAATWPSRGDVHSALGAALSAARRPEEAVAAFRVAAAAEPHNADAHGRLAAALLAAGQARAAAVAAAAALQLQPQHGAATAVRCWALRQEGDAAHAAEADALCKRAAQQPGAAAAGFAGG